MLLRRHHKIKTPGPRQEKKPAQPTEIPTVKELREQAREAGIEGYWSLRKEELLEALER